MNIIEKRDFIHSYLNRVDEKTINELYRKLQSLVKVSDPVVGYTASGQAITRSRFIADIREAEEQIERGEYLTIEELEKDSQLW
jgi:hypothetical protein